MELEPALAKILHNNNIRPKISSTKIVSSSIKDYCKNTSEAVEYIKLIESENILEKLYYSKNVELDSALLRTKLCKLFQETIVIKYINITLRALNHRFQILDSTIGKSVTLNADGRTNSDVDTLDNASSLAQRGRLMANQDIVIPSKTQVEIKDDDELTILGTKGKVRF